MSPGNARSTASIDYAEPLTLGWTVPSNPVGNTFPVTLTSNYALEGVALDDFRLIQRNPNNFINLNTSESEIDAVTLTQVPDTHNWRIDFTLNGTYDNPFEIRLVRNRVQYDGDNVPSSNLNSARWTVDSSLVPPAAPANVRGTARPTSILVEWDTVSHPDLSDHEISVDSGEWESTGSTAASANITNLEKGTEYDIQVRGVAGTLNGAASDVLTISTTTTVPGALENVVITPGSGSNATTASIAFNLPTDTGGTPIIGIDVRYAKGTTIPSNTVWQDAGTTTSPIQLTNLDESTQYAVELRARNADGGGASSGVETFTTQALPSITASITFNMASLQARGTARATIRTSETVTGLGISHLSVNRGTLSNFQAVSGTEYTVDIQAPYTGSEIILALAANAVNEGNAETQASIRMIPAVRQGLFILGENNAIYHVPDNFAAGQSLTNADIINFNIFPNVQLPSGATMDADDNLYVIMLDTLTQRRNIYVVPTDTSATGSGYIQRTILLPPVITSPSGLAIDGNHNLYVADATNGAIYVIPADTDDNTEAVISKTILLPDVSDTPVGLAIDGSNLYVIHSVSGSTDDVVHVIPASTPDNTEAAISKTILLPNQIAQPHGLVISGGDIYIADTTNTGVYVIPANTADDTEAVISKTILINDIATNIVITAIAIDSSDNLYLGNLEDDNVYVIPASTANNAEAVASRTLYLSRHNLNNAFGISVDANRNLYISNGRTSRNYEIYVLNANTPPAATAYIQRVFTLDGSDLAPGTGFSFSFQGIEVDTDGNLYVGSNLRLSDDSETPHIRVYDANTADGGLAPLIREFRISRINSHSNLHSPNIDSLSVDDSDNLYSGGPFFISVFSANSANGTTITPREFRLIDFETQPSGIRLSELAVEVDGNNLYLLGRDLVGFQTQSTYKFYVVPADTADGVQAIATYAAVVPSDIVLPSDMDFQDGLRPPVITTDTTDIRGGNSVGFDIVFPESVTDFVIGDIMIEGGTGTALTGSGTDYVLTVATATGAGEVEITIPNDVVNPGNFASYAVFERSAHATVTITLPSDAPTGEAVTAIVEFSENITGLTDSDFSVDVGSITGLSGSGSLYRLFMTTPTSENGVMTLTLAASAVDQGNIERQATLFYFEGIRHGLYVLQEPSTITQLKGVHVVPDYVAQGETLSDADIPSFNFLPALDNLSGMGIDSNGNLFVAMRASGLPDPSSIFTDDVIVTVPTDTAVTGRGYVQDIDRLLSSFTVPPDTTTYQLGTPRGVGVSGSNRVWIVDSTQDILFQVRGVGAGSVAALPSTIGSPSGLAISGSDFYIADDIDRRIYVCRISGNAATINRTILLPSAIGDPNGLAIDGNDLYIADDSGDEVYVIPANTANNTTAVISKTIELPNTIASPSALAIDGNNLWIGDATDDAVYRVNANTPNNTEATIQETLNLAIYINAPEAITLDANGLLYVADQASVPGDSQNRRGIYVMSADISDGQFGYIQRTVYLPATISKPRGLTIDGNHFYVADETDRAVYQMSLPTTDKAEASITKTINLPGDISNPQALAFGSNKLYIADDTDNNIYVIDATTPNNQTASIEKTILIRGGGVSNIRGLAVDGRLLHFSSYRVLVNTTDVKISSILTDTADNAEADFIQSIALPESINRPFAMAFQPVPQITTNLDLEITSPYPTRYVTDIGMNALIAGISGTPDDPPDLNDYPIYLKWNQDVSGFDSDDVQIINATLQSFEKISDSEYTAIVRPPDTGTGAVIVRVALNAIPTGSNQETAFFAYTDRVTSQLIFNSRNVISGLQSGDTRYPTPIHIEGNRIYMLAGIGSAPYTIKVFSADHAGMRYLTEDIDVDYTNNLRLGFITQLNGIYVISQANDTTFRELREFVDGRWEKFAFTGALGFKAGAIPADPRSVDWNRWGLFFPPDDYDDPFFASDFGIMPQEITDGDPSTVSIMGQFTTLSFSWDGAKAQGDRVYWQNYDTNPSLQLLPIRVTRAVDDTMGEEIVSERLNPLSETEYTRIAVYGSWMYYMTDARNLYRFDLRQYRAPEVRKNILPQFVTEGESLDLKVFVDGAAVIDFEFGFDTPNYLSIDSNLNLSVADGVIADDTTVLVKLSTYSLRAQTDFEFYLVIAKKKAPVAKDVDVLPMDNGETYNLLRLFTGADSVDWRGGFTPPSGYTIANSQLTMTGQTSEALTEIQVTGTNIHGDTDLTTDVHPYVPSAIVSSESVDYRVIIGGIDVSDDLNGIPSVHNSLDTIQPFHFVSDDASFVLSSPAGRYDGRVDGNFWDTNGLNKNGYLERVELWADILDDPNNIQSKMLFQGVVNKVNSSINAVTATVHCLDLTRLLKNAELPKIGIQKFAELAEVRETYQGEYKPDDSLLPILPDTAAIRRADNQVLDISAYKHAPSAVIPDIPQAYVTDSGVFVSGGYLDDAPLTKFQTPYRSREIGFLIRELSEAAGYFNPSVRIATAEPSTTHHIFSRGNIAFNVEDTKIVRNDC